MKAICICALILAMARGAFAAGETLADAKDLYASAAYGDALAVLSKLDVGSAEPDVARQVDEYRAFCLFALGQTREAESVAESIIRKNPMRLLDSTDASPRIQAMFTDVRKRLLPSLARERFRAARAAFDGKRFSDAASMLADTQQLLAETGKLGVTDPTLADLTVLVDGFIELTRTSVEEHQQASAPPTRPETPTTPPAAQPAAAPSTPHVYSAADEGVVPPVTLSQRLPSMTTEMQTIVRSLGAKGVVEIVIDESGKVVDVSVRQSLNASYDSLVVAAAQQWKYRPATHDGTPVRFRKTLVLEP